MKLKMEHICAGYDGDVVLKDLSLEVEEGEFLSLLGPSGCGKSTLMKTIAGILPAHSGRIFLDGRDITNLPVHKRGTVVMFQDMRLFPHKSVAENVAFPLKMQGMPKAERLETASELLKKVQMGGFESRRPAELSGGQQQRIALARALAARPKLLLLDEPFSALDENLREDMRHLVLQLQKEFRTTVILVTHDREEALSMSDRVALMFGGKVAQVGTPQAVYSQPKTVEVADYFGNCVYLPGAVSDGRFTGSGISCPVPAADGRYRMMLRPDCLDTEHGGDYRLTVERISFRGTDTLVEFRSDAGILWKKTCPAGISLGVGDRICAELHITAPVLFPEEETQQSKNM